MTVRICPDCDTEGRHSPLKIGGYGWVCMHCDTVLEKDAPTANAIQHGGSHYTNKTIQPWDFIAANNIGFLEGNAIKYLSRWRDKGGIEDIKKAIHYCEKLIEVETAKGRHNA